MSFHKPSHQRLVETFHRQGQQHDAQAAQGRQLGPEDIEPDALEKDAPDDHDVVAQRVEVCQPLNRFGHVGDGKGETGQQHGGKDDEEGGHHGLLLGLADRGDQQPGPQGAHQEQGRCQKQEPQAAAYRHIENQCADQADQGHIDVADQYEGKRLTQDELPLADGGDNDLLDGADLLFADNGQR